MATEPDEVGHLIKKINHDQGEEEEPWSTGGPGPWRPMGRGHWHAAVAARNGFSRVDLDGASDNFWTGMV